MLVKFLETQGGHLRKRLKGTFRITVKRQLRQVDKSGKTSWKRLMSLRKQGSQVTQKRKVKVKGARNNGYPLLFPILKKWDFLGGGTPN